MARVRDIKTFDAVEYRSTVADMSKRRERTHALGERQFETTGQLPRDVDIRGKIRRSRNAMVRDGERFKLVNGPKLPSVYLVDGTGSMAQNLTRALHAMEQLFDMLGRLRTRYQTDVAFGIVQDVVDMHPVVQLAELESDNRAVTHVRELVPSQSGGDSTEDYDLGALYLDKFVQTDLFDFYGLHGIAVITGDEIGRGFVRAGDVKKHLGHEIEEQQLSLQEICQSLLRRWSLYYVQVGASMPNRVTSWWIERLDPSRVILVPEANYLAQVWAGLSYVHETAKPSLEGFLDFVNATNKPITAREGSMVWDWLQVAEPNFGEQTQLSGYADLPRPGDVFRHLRHAWPIGHPRESENITPPDEVAS